MEFHDIQQEDVIKTIPKKKKCKKAKWLSEQVLQTSWKEEKQKAKEKRKDVPIWKQGTQELQGKKRKHFSVFSAKE